MNYSQLKNLIITLDPKLKEFFFDGDDPAYTVITPAGIRSVMSNDSPEEQIQTAQIERYTTNHKDTLIHELEELLDEQGVYFSDPLGPYWEDEMRMYRWILTAYVSRDERS